MTQTSAIIDPIPFTGVTGFMPYWPPPCDHCLCLVPNEYEIGGRTEPHKKCCHCLKLYREKA